MLYCRKLDSRFVSTLAHQYSEYGSESDRVSENSAKDSQAHSPLGDDFLETSQNEPDSDDDLDSFLKKGTVGQFRSRLLCLLLHELVSVSHFVSILQSLISSVLL